MTESPVDSRRFPNAVSADRADAPICFMRIPRVGGEALVRYLDTFYPSPEILRSDNRSRWSALLAQDPPDLGRFNLLVGNLCGYLSKHFATGFRYMTLVRDPRLRALSHYEYVRRTDGHQLHRLAIELRTFGAYLRDSRTQPTVVNYTLRCIGATLDPSQTPVFTPHSANELCELETTLETMPAREDVVTLFSAACARLDQMCFVGITERLAESFGLASAIFGWPAPEKALAAPPSSVAALSLARLPPEDLKLLESLNEADMEFYEVATKRFERDWKRSRFFYPRLHAFVSHAQNCEDVILHRALRDVKRTTTVLTHGSPPCSRLLFTRA